MAARKFFLVCAGLFLRTKPAILGLVALAVWSLCTSADSPSTDSRSAATTYRAVCVLIESHPDMTKFREGLRALGFPDTPWEVQAPDGLVHVALTSSHELGVGYVLSQRAKLQPEIFGLLSTRAAIVSPSGADELSFYFKSESEEDTVTRWVTISLRDGAWTKSGESVFWRAR
jgi:hypothetical protein